MKCAIPCYIGPCYNGNRLYLWMGLSRVSEISEIRIYELWPSSNHNRVPGPALYNDFLNTTVSSGNEIQPTWYVARACVYLFYKISYVYSFCAVPLLSFDYQLVNSFCRT